MGRGAWAMQGMGKVFGKFQQFIVLCSKVVMTQKSRSIRFSQGVQVILKMKSRKSVVPGHPGLS